MIKRLIIGGLITLLPFQSIAQELSVALPELNLETAFYYDNWIYGTDTFFVAPIYFDSFISFTDFSFNVRYSSTHLMPLSEHLTEINSEDYVMVANYMGAADFAMISEGSLSVTVFPVSATESMLSVSYTGPAIPKNFYNSCNGHLMYLAFKKLTPCYEDPLSMEFWNGDADGAFVNPTQTAAFSLTGEQLYTTADSSLLVQNGFVQFNALSGEIIQNGSLLEANISGGIQPYGYQWLDSTANLLDDNLFYSPIAEGAYTLEVTDVTGCVFTETITFTEGATLNEMFRNDLVYPNPAKQSLNIILSEPYNYRLTDLQGRILQTGQGFGQSKLERNHYKNGLYLLQIKTKGEQHNLKVIFN